MLGVALLDVLLVTFTRVKGEMMVERHPIITNALQGAVLVFAGYQPTLARIRKCIQGCRFGLFFARTARIRTPRTRGLPPRSCTRTDKIHPPV
jgi:hypothetical protein